MEALLSQIVDHNGDSLTVDGIIIKRHNWPSQESKEDKRFGSGQPALEVTGTVANLKSLAAKCGFQLGEDDIKQILKSYFKRHLEILFDLRKIDQGHGAENWHFLLLLWHPEDVYKNQEKFIGKWDSRRKAIESKTAPVHLSPVTNSLRGEQVGRYKYELMYEVIEDRDGNKSFRSAAKLIGDVGGIIPQQLREDFQTLIRAILEDGVNLWSEAGESTNEKDWKEEENDGEEENSDIR